MANDYMVRVYDCSMVQDYALGYDKWFESESDAMAYAESCMKDFANSSLYEYSAELFVWSHSAYIPYAYYEFDCFASDEDIFDIIDSFDGTYSYHDMF